jgi:hypothetical protein
MKNKYHLVESLKFPIFNKKTVFIINNRLHPHHH